MVDTVSIMREARKQYYGLCHVSHYYWGGWKTKLWLISCQSVILGWPVNNTVVDTKSPSIIRVATKNIVVDNMSASIIRVDSKQY